jgi:DnaJ-class molecular chaperone
MEYKAEIREGDVVCDSCNGHGIVSHYSHEDFEGAMECPTCCGRGELWQYKTGHLAIYKGGPFAGSASLKKS